MEMVKQKLNGIEIVSHGVLDAYGMDKRHSPPEKIVYEVVGCITG